MEQSHTYIYENALKSSGYAETLTYNHHKPSTRTKRNRQRNIIWYNPPYSMNVQTNIGRTFLRLIEKHFPKHHRLHRIFNKNNVKVSYSCMENMETIISKHNKKITNTNTATISEKTCNGRKKDQCPLDNNCLSPSIIYNAKVTTNEDTFGNNYIGLTEGTFKQRFTQHKLSLRNRKYANSTELSKHIWDLKDNNKDYNIEWSIITSPDHTATSQNKKMWSLLNRKATHYQSKQRQTSKQTIRTNLQMPTRKQVLS